jgi:uncharacterized spore protein YtfJ
MDLGQIGNLLTQIQGSARVTTAVGEPVQVGDRVIIPVAEVAYGGGGGGGTTTESTAEENRGSGGGGGVRIRPLGCWSIGPDGERWIPALDVTRLLMVGGAVAIAVLWLLRGLARRR